MKKITVVLLALLCLSWSHPRVWPEHHKHCMPNLIQIGTISGGLTVDPHSTTSFTSDQSLNLVQGQVFVLQGQDISGSGMDFFTMNVAHVSSDVFYIANWQNSTSDIPGTGTMTGTVNIYVYAPGSTSFTPQKLFNYQGQVWIRDTNGQFYIYGGANGQGFDTALAIVTLPWSDLKTPTIEKTLQSVDYVCQGQWTIQASMDYDGVQAASDSLKTVATSLSSPVSPTPVVTSTQSHEQSITDDGFHVQLQATSSDPTAPGAKLSSLIVNYQVNEPK